MNAKAVLILCLIFFAIASPIVTITTAAGTWASDVHVTTRTITYETESGIYQPTGGDPIDSDFPPASPH